MKSKKILGLLLACSLGFSVLPGQAFASGVKTGESAPHYVAPDIKTITEKLFRDGIIDENTTEEEMREITKKYFGNSETHAPVSLEEKAKRQEIISRMEKYGIKKEFFGSKSFKVGNRSIGVPQRIQEEKFGGNLHVAKPLVILMDFQDYKFGDMAKENLEYKFDNYDTQYFQEMLFNDETFEGPNGEELMTMKQYYLQQSGGSYTVDGSVTGWYTAKENAKFYGEMMSEQKKDRDARAFIREALVAAAADKSVNLADYDVEDRYDYDKDGDFNEPDGVIDHIIVVHAGVGQEQGGGTLGDDAMWSHRWVLGQTNFVFEDHNGKEWKANDYTLQPQSGAVGVFAHEYGHDLGLPDEYDTSGASAGGSPVGAWSIMSGGSWSGKIAGTQPTGFSAWAKEFLQASMPNSNWLKGATINLNNIPQAGYTLLLDEASSKGVNNDVVRIDLPDYDVAMVSMVEGDKVAYGGKGNNLDNNMKINIDLTNKADATLKFKTNYSIEKGWDWASVEVAPAGTDEFKTVLGNLPILPSATSTGIEIENGITGYSRLIEGNDDGWVDAVFDLSAYAGQNIDVRFRYQTDAYTAENGWFIDKLTVESEGKVLLSDNFEGASDFEFNGFEMSTASESFSHYYLAEWRNQSKADLGLKYANEYVEYSPGLVLWYVNNDRYQEKNHVAKHPGEGFLSVVDADQQIDPYMVNGRPYSYGPSANRLHDAAFGLDETVGYDNVVFFTTASGLKVGYNDTETFMNPYFSDAKSYTNGNTPRLMEGGVKLKKYGLRIYVTGQSKDKSVARIQVMREQ